MMDTMSNCTTVLSTPAKKVGEHCDGLDKAYTGDSVTRRLV